MYSMMTTVNSTVIYSAAWGFPGGANGKKPACQCR